MKKEINGILEMTLCAALWSMAGVMLKYIPWNPLVTAGIRGLLAGMIMLGYLRIRQYRVLLNRKSVLGGLAAALTSALFVVANKLTTAANAIVLQYTSPVFILMLSVLFLKKRFRKEDMLAVAVTLGGISLFFFDQLESGAMIGNLVAVLAGASMAVMYLILGEITEEERMSAILVGELATALMGIPFLFTTEIEMSISPIIFVVLMGLFQLGIPYILYCKAAGKCSALSCCLIGALEPLLNPVWVMLFYGERPGPFALAGGLIVIGSVTMWSVQSAKRRSSEIKEATHITE